MVVGVGVLVVQVNAMAHVAEVVTDLLHHIKIYY